MLKVSNKFYSFIALLFVFLSLLGYQLATTLLLPLSSDSEAVSSTVTYPYRAIVFLLAFFLIILSPIEKVKTANKNTVILYVVFMLIYFVRILIDIFVREIYVQPGFQRVVLQYMFIVMIPSIWATSRCAVYIDYEKLNRWLLIGSIVLLGITIMNQNSLIAIEYEEVTRGEGNVALGTLGFGYSCVCVFLILLSQLTYSKQRKWILKAILVLLMAISFVMMLRAASRGPLVTLTIIVLFSLFSRTKYKVIGLVVSLLVVVIIWLNLASVLDWLGNISPMMEQRMAATMYEEDSSGRDVLYRAAFNIFLQNPILGQQFVLGDGFYSHNSILDVMIGLGFFGAVVWVYLIFRDIKLSYRTVLNRTPLMTIGLLSAQFILKGFFSGAMYNSNETAICLLIMYSVVSGKMELDEDQIIHGQKVFE